MYIFGRFNFGRMIYFLLVIAMIFWSFSFIWYKEVYVNFSPLTVIFLRLVISSFILFLFTASLGKLQKLESKDVRFFLLAAFFEPFIYFLGEAFGMKLISSTLAAVIVATIPLFTPIAAVYFYNERLSKINISGLILSIAGVCMVVFEKGFAINASLSGILLMLLAVSGAIGYSVCVKKLAGRYNAFTIVAWQNLIGAIYFIPLFLFFNPGLEKIFSHPIESYIPVFKMAIFASTLAFMFFTMGISKIGICRANIFTNIIPVFTAILSFLLLGERFTWIKIAGIGVVITGLILSQMEVFSPRIQKAIEQTG
jgi:drug/metabolite transporter (DMT)-like permease